MDFSRPLIIFNYLKSYTQLQIIPVYMKRNLRFWKFHFEPRISNSFSLCLILSNIPKHASFNSDI